MASLTRTVAPSASLHTLVELKRHLRVDFDDDDAVITAVGASAEGWLDGADGVLGRALVTQTWVWAGPAPSGLARLPLPLAPVQSIESVQVYNADGVLTAVTGWRLIGADRCPALEPTAAWPATDGRAEALQVTFVAGYGDPADVPGPIRSAALLIAGALYENREDVVLGTTISSLPLGVAALTAAYRRGPV